MEIEEICSTLQNGGTKNKDIFSSILKDVHDIAKMFVEETPISISREMSFQETSNMYNQVEKQMKNIDETLYIISNIRKLLSDFEEAAASC